MTNKQKILAIKLVAKKNPEGFTVELTTLTRVTQGISVAYLETQDSFGDEGLNKVLEHSLTHDNVVGGWLNAEDGNYYFDSCKIFKNLTDAIDFGRQNKQIAIFDITNLNLIFL